MRTFDPMKDQHPVQWLLDHLKPEIYSPMYDWIKEVMNADPGHPNTCLMPDLGKTCLKCVGGVTVEIISHYLLLIAFL